MQGPSRSENLGTIENLKIYLRSKGINPSFYRLKILDYLIRMKNHPTADLLYHELLSETPTLSRTTIYNTLNTFLGKGVVSALTIDENEVRYDASTDPHAHFKCIRCGKLTDIPIKAGKLRALLGDGTAGHRIMESHVYLKGVCRDCAR